MSPLHLIAAISEKEEATELCRQLMQNVKNLLNRDHLLYMRTVEEFDMGCGWEAQCPARVAAIHIAAYNGNSGVVRILCQDYGVDANCCMSEILVEKPKKDITPLEWAARKGHSAVVKVLVENNANVNTARNTHGVTAVYIAAQNGHVDVVKMLLEYKADINASIHTDGTTALYIAAQNGHIDVVKTLLVNKADVNASIHTGATVLYIAAEKGHVDVVKTLLENKANVNASNHTDGATSLYAAAWNGHVDIVKMLLANNAV